MMFHIQNPNRPLPLQLELIGVDHHQEPIVRPGGMPFFQWFYCVKGQGLSFVDSGNLRTPSPDDLPDTRPQYFRSYKERFA